MKQSSFTDEAWTMAKDDDEARHALNYILDQDNKDKLLRKIDVLVKKMIGRDAKRQRREDGALPEQGEASVTLTFTHDDHYPGMMNIPIIIVQAGARLL